MAKRRYEFDEAKHARFLKEGRGQGTLGEYKPWLTIHDVPSTGRVSRIPGVTCQRQHHALSDIETGLIHLLDWSADVVDIREQFPLDRDMTRQIAKDMAVEHPRDPHSGVDIVMTTDVLASVICSTGTRLIAYAGKCSSDLDDPRTIEKLEIERRYWDIQAKEVDWTLYTERELPSQRIANIAWANEMYSLEGITSLYDGYWSDRCTRVIHELDAIPVATSVKQFFDFLEVNHGFRLGEGLTALRHLVAIRILAIDMDKPFEVSGSVGQLQIQSPAGRTKWKAA
ncbi:Transposon Tn7 transposition protein TnsA [Andreprevotia sp. IGB-42]|uniref:TnsA endonuclease N-terminal domain-containing protein n=1 Tax=Andreprevotia sp. IGB-42 TaxID=2497473 RepID=UPI00135BC354|nr:TnsA endonuclease N-terminal domain-containing protein [Andreprevotia sp. IGB-42]KAF0813934.1 Transposon Tn7 transposition protein TnsA [Andreprevotia sp. IGB-42]